MEEDICWPYVLRRLGQESFWFEVDVIGCADNLGQGSQCVADVVEAVADDVVERCLAVASTGEEMITVWIEESTAFA